MARSRKKTKTREPKAEGDAKTDLRDAKTAICLADAAAKHRAVVADRLEQWVKAQAQICAGAPIDVALGDRPCLTAQMLRDPRAPEELLATAEVTVDTLLEAGAPIGAFECEARHADAIADAIAQAPPTGERSLVVLSALDSLLLPAGQLVLLVGLRARPELNGRHGFILGPRGGGRYPVLVCPFTAIDPQHGSLSITPTMEQPEERILLKPQNLRLWRFAEPQVRPEALRRDPLWRAASFRRAALLFLLRAALDQEDSGLLEGVIGRAAHTQQRRGARVGASDECLRLDLAINTPINSKQNTLLHAEAQVAQDEVSHRCLQGTLARAEALLHAGADPRLRNCHGASAVGIACAKGRDDLVRLMCEHDEGAFLECVHVPDDHGAYPITVAACYGHASTVRLLLDLTSAATATVSRDGRGAVPPHSQEELHSALRDACSNSRHECVALLLRSKADPNFAPSASQPAVEPALLCACKPSDGPAARRTLELLLEAGALPDRAAADGTTAFAYSCQLGHASLAARMLEAGADASLASKKAISPLLLALDSGFQQCADLALTACRERAESSGAPELYEQALADVESFGALPRHSYRANVAARGAEQGAEQTSLRGMTLATDADIPRDEGGAPLECPVCMLAFKRLDRVAMLGCGHAFHALCLFRWLDVQPSCPVCRKQPKVDDETE